MSALAACTNAPSASPVDPVPLAGPSSASPASPLPDDDYEQLAIELIDTRFDHAQLGAEQRMSRVLSGESFALNFIYEHTASDRAGTCHPKDISRRMGVTAARVASILKSLERRGLLTRSADPIDSRQVVVTLTEQGICEVRRHRQETLDAIVRVLRSLGLRDSLELVRLMKKLASCLASEAMGNPNAPNVEKCREEVAVVRRSS